MVIICKDIQSVREAIHKKKLENDKPYYEVKVSFVPTMGYLHQGHLSLVSRAKQEGDISVVSIFVNPTQFNANEDLSTYPVDIENDTRLLESVQTDILFLPTPQLMYPNEYSTYVSVDSMDQVLEGKARPGHFRGVATVVSKLLNIVQPHSLLIGQKDAMQCICIRRLVEDLNFNTKVIVCDTVREDNGLAKSSRNSYLSQEEQKQASLINETMNQFKNNTQSFNNRTEFIDALTKEIEKNPLMKVEYISIASQSTGLEINDDIYPPPPLSNLSLAVFFQGEKRKTRLIDVILF
ncbi:hypothetical protein CYY_008279 [Polysphondylium violaceum]|uniref:Pantoate--beta-alanine ligase n=1 Tax=Polysphondylium violaceum TaxID=133409 RepID=A0A8J4V444_9MYCE|nr:hypothetical protein CYY_008279 [Polysphondylium violaceum]